MMPMSSFSTAACADVGEDEDGGGTASSIMLLADPDGEKRPESKPEEPQAADVDPATTRRGSSTKHHGATIEQLQQLLIRKLRDAAEE
jgi:hypothetical protein